MLCRSSFWGIYWGRFLVIVTSWSQKKHVCEWSFVTAISCHLKDFIYLFPEEKLPLLEEPIQPALSFHGERGRKKIFSLGYFLLKQGIIWEHCFDLSISEYIFRFSAAQVLSRVEAVSLKGFYSPDHSVSTHPTQPFLARLCVCSHSFFLRSEEWVFVCIFACYTNWAIFSMLADNNSIKIAVSLVHHCLGNALQWQFGLGDFIIAWGLFMFSPRLKIKIPVVIVGWLATSPIPWCQTDPANLTSLSQVSMDTLVEHMLQSKRQGVWFTKAFSIVIMEMLLSNINLLQ